MTLPEFHIAKLADSVRSRLRRRRLARELTNAANVFVKANDVIAINKLMGVQHEPVLTALIAHYADKGLGGFLLDIGANIGLTSCQCGVAFEQVHLFEPSPLCQKIAEVNLALNLRQHSWTLHRFGLGSSEYTAVLCVPPGNWGGAWIKSLDQSYTPAVLSRKENVSRLDDIEFVEVEVEVRKASTELSRVLQSLEEQGIRRGIIKIDVEGMEPTILAGLAEVLSRGTKVMIVFESFDNNADVTEIERRFGNRVSSWVVRKDRPGIWGGSRIGGVIRAAIGGVDRFRLVPFSAGAREEMYGKEIVMFVNCDPLNL